MKKELQEIKSPLTDIEPKDMLKKIETIPYDAPEGDKDTL